MKKIIELIIIVVVLILAAYFIKDNFYIVKNKIEYVYLKYLQPELKQNLVDSKYKKAKNYEYVKINTDTTLKNKDDIKNAVYTFLDSGWDEYKLRCDVDYLNCINDAKDIVLNKTNISSISYFIHPYNTFTKINMGFSPTGKIVLKRTKKYSDEEIKIIDEKINEIYKENYNPKKTTKENIKIFHDYIINHTTYDVKNNSIDSNYPSGTAYGVLTEGVGICSGYTDTMALFLEKMNVKNYRIASSTHIWNLVYIEGKWLHLDLTWDDPLTDDGSEKLTNDYFLISTEELKNKNDDQHDFDENVFIEAK